MAVSVADLARIGPGLKPDAYDRLVAKAVRRMPPTRRPRDTAGPQFDAETRGPVSLPSFTR